MPVDLCKHLELPELCEPCIAGQNGHDSSRARGMYLLSSKEEQEQEQEPRLWRTAKEVRAAAKDAPRRYWPVPGLLAPGLTLFFAQPKAGKTRLLVDIGWSVASGNNALNSVGTHQGDVLMILSETNRIALDDMWQETFPDEVDVPDRLSVMALEEWQDAARVDNSPHALGQRVLEPWRQSVEKPVLVIIDNLSNCVLTRHVGDQRKGLQENDRKALDPFHSWANRHGISLVMIHHTNKGKLEKDTPWLTAAAGSNGLTAVPDDLMMLYETLDQESESYALGLKYQGRNLGKKKDWTLFWRGGRIHMFDTVEVSDRLGDQMRVVLEGVAALGEASPKDIAIKTGVPQNTVAQYLVRLAKKNLIVRSSHGVYRLGMVDEDG